MKLRLFMISFCAMLLTACASVSFAENTSAKNGVYCPGPNGSCRYTGTNDWVEFRNVSNGLYYRNLGINQSISGGALGYVSPAVTTIFYYPACASFGSRIWLAFNGYQNKLYFGYSDDGGASFKYNGSNGFGSTTSVIYGSPAAIFFNNQILIFAKTASTGSIKQWTVSSSTSTTVASLTPTTITAASGTNITSAPAAYVVGTNAFLGWRANGNLVGTYRTTSSSWATTAVTSIDLVQNLHRPYYNEDPPITQYWGAIMNANPVPDGRYWTYIRPGWQTLNAKTMKFVLRYDASSTNWFACNESRIRDAIADGVKTIILRTADTQIGDANTFFNVYQFPDVVAPSTTHKTLKQFLDDIFGSGLGVGVVIEVGNEPNELHEQTDGSMETASSAEDYRTDVLDFIEDAKIILPPAGVIRPIQYIASLTSDPAGLDTYRPWLSTILARETGGAQRKLDEVADGFGVHVYTFFDFTSYDSSKPLKVLRDTLSLAKINTPIYLTEVGINSPRQTIYVDLNGDGTPETIPGLIEQGKAFYTQDLMMAMPAQVRALTMFAYDLDPQWYSVGPPDANGNRAYAFYTINGKYNEFDDGVVRYDDTKPFENGWLQYF